MSVAFARRAFECYVYNYRRTWRGSVLSTFAMPLIYLGAMGLGVGALIDDPATNRALGGSYLQFLAPGLLAAAVVTMVFGECTWPVISQVKWDKSFYAMLATPLRPFDIVLGNIAFVGVRAGITSVAFFVAMTAFGVVHTPWALLTVPVGVLTGLALATPVYAFAIRRQNEASFSLLFRLGSIPLFLFSGTFFPVSALPVVIQPVAYASPLWHGVDLCRALMAAAPASWPALLHVGYLLLWLGTGLVLAIGGFTKRMVV